MNQRTIPSVLTRAILPILPIVLATTAEADLSNKVTVSGKIIYASEPVDKFSGNTYSFTSKLASFSITNASILDAMIQDGDLTTKTGYTIIERLTTDGDSLGYFATNPKTGDTVEVSTSIMSHFLQDSTGAEAISGAAKISQGEVTAITSVKSSFNMVATGKFLASDASAFLTGSRSMVAKSVKIDGVSTPIRYIAISYSAVVRAPYAEEAIIDAKIASGGTVYIYDAETGTGF